MSLASELHANVGQTGRFEVNGLAVEVKVLDARVRFGHVDFLLTPVAGDGTRWVESTRVALTPRRPLGLGRETEWPFPE